MAEAVADRPQPLVALLRAEDEQAALLHSAVRVDLRRRRPADALRLPGRVRHPRHDPTLRAASVARARGISEARAAGSDTPAIRTSRPRNHLVARRQGAVADRLADRNAHVRAQPYPPPSLSGTCA